MSLKLILYKQCFQLVDPRFASIQHHVADIQNSLLSYIQSRAGDKH